MNPVATPRERTHLWAALSAIAGAGLFIAGSFLPHSTLSAAGAALPVSITAIDPQRELGFWIYETLPVYGLALAIFAGAALAWLRGAGHRRDALLLSAGIITTAIAVSRVGALWIHEGARPRLGGYLGILGGLLVLGAARALRTGHSGRAIAGMIRAGAILGGALFVAGTILPFASVESEVRVFFEAVPVDFTGETAETLWGLVLPAGVILVAALALRAGAARAGPLLAVAGLYALLFFGRLLGQIILRPARIEAGVVLGLASAIVLGLAAYGAIRPRPGAPEGG